MDRVRDEILAATTAAAIARATNWATSGNSGPRRQGLRGARTPRRLYKKKNLYKNTGKTVKKQIKEIKKSLKSDQASHIYRLRTTSKIDCNNNEVDNTEFAVMRTTELEAAMANLRYYDPSVPGTLVTADASTGTYTRQIHFKNVHERLTLRNNYQVPCIIRVWYCTPKNDTSISAHTFYTAGIADQCIGGVNTSPLLYPSDINNVNANWNLHMMKNMILQPGSQTSCAKSTGAFDYDPAQVDSHNLAYQKKYKAHTWYIRIEGVIGHDSVSAQFSTLPAAVDVFMDRKYEITYDAGVNLNDYSYTNSSTAFTGTGLVSNKPVSDNQSFSTT